MTFTRLTRLLVAGVTILGAFTMVSTSASGSPSGGAHASTKATLSTFEHSWVGHTRFLKINTHGHAKESVGDGCCHPVVNLTFSISDPRGTAAHASARAKVLTVKVLDKGEFSKKHPAPHVGEVRRIKLRHGVLHETLSGQIYCDQTAEAKGTCGA